MGTHRTPLSRSAALGVALATAIPWLAAGAPALAASLCENRADALLFRELATLRTDVPLAESMDDLRWRGPDVGALTALASAWGDDTIVERAVRFANR